MLSRRQFFGAVGRPAAVSVVAASFNPLVLPDIFNALSNHLGSPEEVAGDEEFWFQIQQAFTVDRSLVNLNNGGVSPAPAMVQEAMKRHLY